MDKQPSKIIKGMWYILQEKNPLVSKEELLPFAIMDYLDMQHSKYKDKVIQFYNLRKEKKSNGQT